MSSFVVSLLTWWVTPCNHTLVFSYCEVLLWLDLITVVLFFPPSRMMSLPFQTCGQPGNKSERTGCEVWRSKRIKSGLELKWNHFCANWGIQTAVNHQPVAVGTRSDDSRCWPLTFVMVFFFPTPLTINWYAVSSGHGWLQRQSQHAHTTPIIISGLRAFHALKDVFVFVWEIMGVRSAKRGDNMTWVRK